MMSYVYSQAGKSMVYLSVTRLDVKSDNDPTEIMMLT